MSDIQAGDTVKLKSGGELMTVEWVEDGQASCVWHDGKKPMREGYALVVLEKFDLKGDAAAFRATRGG